MDIDTNVLLCTEVGFLYNLLVSSLYDGFVPRSNTATNSSFTDFLGFFYL